MVSEQQQPVDPWAMQERETSRAYEAFRRFRDLGPTRSIVDVEGPIGTLRGWAKKFDWTTRAQAWDQECYRVDDARRLAAIRDMDESHRTIARALVKAGLDALQKSPELTPTQATRLVDLGTRMERAALLGEHVPSLPSPEPVGDDESPLERIARELSDTA